jgi:adenylate cyclase
MKQMNGVFPVRELSKAAVVGRKEPVFVYEPMMHDEFERRKQQLARFAEGLSLFYKGDFSEALGIFSEISETDPTAKAYTAKCHELIDNPPAEWQGVWVITAK